MASLDLTRLMANCRVHLPGALDTAIQFELFNVLDDFFQNTNIWQEDITFNVTAGDFAVLGQPAPDKAVIYYIEQSSVSNMIRLMGIMDNNNLPVAGYMVTPGEITLQLSPGNTTTFTATVALTIDDPVAASGANAGFPEFPDWVLDRYLMGIISGVVSRMMMQPAKPYSSPQLSTYHGRKFSQATQRAKGEALHQNVNNGQTWSFPQAFATTRNK